VGMERVGDRMIMKRGCCWERRSNLDSMVRIRVSLDRVLRRSEEEGNVLEKKREFQKQGDHARRAR
jgi:hypothetical protein